MSVVWEVLLFIVTTLETGLGFAFYHMLTGKKYDVRWKWIVEGVGVLVIAWSWAFNRQIALVSNGNVVCNVLLSFLVLIILENKDAITTLAIMSVYMITNELLNILYGTFFLRSLGKERYFVEVHLGQITGQKILIYFMTFSCMMIAWLVLNKKRHKFDIYKLKWILLIFGVIEWLAETWALIRIISQNKEESVWTAGGLIILMIILTSFCIFYINYLIIKSNQEIVEVKNQLLEKNYNETKNLIQNNMINFHDWKNHLLILENYANNGEVEKLKSYLQEIGKSVRILNQYIYINNEVINLIVNTKCVEAKKKEIHVSIEVEDVFPKRIEDYDICCILTNLMDNAIEACEKVPSDKRWIQIEIHKKANIIIIKIENSMEKNLNQKNQVYKTSKKGIHGYGLKSVQSAVEKYGGIMKCVSENEVFSVTISFFEKEEL